MSTTKPAQSARLIDPMVLRTPAAPRRRTVLALLAIGIVTIGISFRLAAEGMPAVLYYTVFWVGMLSALLPVAFQAVAATSARRDRLLAVTLFAVISGFPKFLRNPFAPSYHDEYAHYRAAIDVLDTGHLFVPNALIPIVQSFPGTSAVTAVLHLLSGLPVWISGVTIVHVLHAAGIVAVFFIVDGCLNSSRAGAIGAIVYAINPSAVYFSTQYAYESITINYFLWILALGVLAARTLDRRRRYGLLLTAIVLGMATIVTHHLTALFLTAALVGLLVVALLWPSLRKWRTDDRPQLNPRPERQTWLVLLVGFVLTVAGWVTWAAPATIDYLRPYFGGSVVELNSIARDDGDTGRRLLADSVQPIWERAFTAAAPVLLGLIALVVVWAIWRDRNRWYSTAVGLMAFGMIYFPAVLFILAPSGAEGARRSWGFTYVGIAVIAAFVLLRPSDRMSSRTRSWLAGVGFVVLLIGNVGGGLNDPYRFPGPWRWGTDTRSASPEAKIVGEALAAQAGRVRVVTDAYTSLQLAAYGGHDIAAPSLGFPAWELVQRDDDPSPELAQMLLTSQYNYLVVDVRMAEEAAFNGHNFGQHDPLLTLPTPKKNLDRLNVVPWASLVITTEHLRVYRLDLQLIGQSINQSGSNDGGGS